MEVLIIIVKFFLFIIFIHPKLVKLLSIINLDDKKKSPPSGMLIYDKLLFVVFYKTNNLKMTDLSDNNKLILDLNSNILGNPLGICRYKEKF